MKNIFLIIVLFLSIFSCSENERMVFEGESRVYFKNISKDKDTITFSLAPKPSGTTFDIPVALAGYKLTSDKKMRVEIVKEGTTAIEGTHYKLDEEHVFPADTFATSIPIVIYKEDPELRTATKYLTIKLVPTSDLNIIYDDKVKVVLAITLQLKTPTGTGYYGDMTSFKRLFGDYSKKKHELIIEMAGHDFWDGNYGNYGGANGLYDEEGYYEPFSRQLLQYVMENEVYDENGNLIKPW